jgi:uncharacterized protein (DUF1810 family)
MSQKHLLQRFLDAQESSFSQALTELQWGKKQSHWMWYTFPQIQGLGLSATSKHYALQDEEEAKAFVQHPLLGSRLLQLCEVLLALPNRDATRIMGSPDDVKLRSSMTLFAAVEPTQPIFQQVLDKFYEGIPDPQTLRLLKRHP